jgi:hypothetical protein
VTYLHNGKSYKSHKHPILEYIFNKATGNLTENPDETPFAYEDMYRAMDELGIESSPLARFRTEFRRCP